jgi:hypothetical protein
MKNIVAQHQRTGLVGHKIAADDGRLRQAIGRRLYRVLDAHAPLAAIAQQLGKTRRVLRGADDQHLPDATPRGRLVWELPDPPTL